MSREYLARPLDFAGPSMREMDLPIKRLSPAAGHSYLQLAMDQTSFHLGSHCFGGVQHRVPNAPVSAATAEIPAQPFFHLFHGGVRMGLQKCDAGHHETWRAESALLSVVLHKRAHHGMQLAA